MADDDVLEARHARARLVDDLLGGDDAPAPQRAVDRDDGLGLGVVEPGDDGVGAEPGEQRQHDRPDPGNCQQRDGRLGDVGQIDRDDVAGADAQPPQARGHARDLLGELGIGERQPIAVLTEPFERGLAGGRRISPFVEAVQHDVGAAADAPARPLDAARRIHDRAERLQEAIVDVLQEAAIERLGLGDRPREQIVVIAAATGGDEARQVGVGDGLGAGRPGNWPVSI